MLKIFTSKAKKVLLAMLLLLTVTGCSDSKTKVYYYPFDKDKTEENRIEVKGKLADELLTQLEGMDKADGFDCYFYGQEPMLFTVVEDGQQETFWISNLGIVSSYKGKCYYIDPFSEVFDTAREIYKGEIEKKENEELHRLTVFEIFYHGCTNAKFISPEYCDREYKDTFFVSADTNVEEFVAQFEDNVGKSGPIGKLVSGINSTVTLNGNKEYVIKSISPYDDIGVIVKVR